jgi:hypothetical protein
MRSPATGHCCVTESQATRCSRNFKTPARSNCSDVGAAFATASAEAVETAFDDAIAFSSLSATFEAIQTVAGHDVAGLGSVTELAAAQDATELVNACRRDSSRPLEGPSTPFRKATPIGSR